ncbi:MAG: 3-isopropylmalate dehydratase small subunit [bacterium]|nr:3-isopropylmalate dehydratase small subunit [bacterium]
MIQGKVWKFGDNVDTDQIISSQYLLLPTIEEMKHYTFESLNPDFAKTFTQGDIVVGGANFGCGSSREQAPHVLKALGTSAVIARSFARIFFRNSINIGLALIICDAVYDDVNEGDALSVSFEQGQVLSKGKEYGFQKFPEHLVHIMEAGGLIEYINT